MRSGKNVTMRQVEDQSDSSFVSIGDARQLVLVQGSPSVVDVESQVASFCEGDSNEKSRSRSPSTSCSCLLFGPSLLALFFPFSFRLLCFSVFFLFQKTLPYDTNIRWVGALRSKEGASDVRDAGGCLVRVSQPDMRLQ
jgi:hypothetical protein